ncbi:MAG: ATP-binding protein, partial [Deltaproteobacteria bacterium]
MKADDAFTMERRARLAAERLADVRQKELYRSHRNLSEQAKTLAEQVIERREETKRVKGDLVEATSKLQTAERRLWFSLDAMRDGFAVFDGRGRMVSANSSWLRAFDGLAEVAPGITWKASLLLAVSEGLVDLQGLGGEDWVNEMASRWTEARFEAVIVRLWSGAYVRLDGTRTESGDMICHAQNITKAMRREAHLREAHEQAEAASRAKSAFLATMSHELRTPMNGVLGMTQLLEETPLTDDQHELINTIKSSSEALLRIINDVLDFSKAEAGKLQLVSEPFDLEDVVLDVFSLLSPLVAEKPVALLFDIDMALPTKVLGDSGRFRQVLMNLVGNAIKFTAEGHVLVRLIGLDEGDTTRFVLTVEDTGIGIPEDKLDHVFGEFNQVEGATNRRYEGTGLGLSITKRLVGLMGGEVWVHSAEGEGSSFGIDFNLPRSDEPAGDLAAQPGLGKTVTLAIRHPAVRDILSQQLQHFGCAVVQLDGDQVAPEVDAVMRGQCIGADEIVTHGAPVYVLTPSHRRGETDETATILQYPLSRRRLQDFVASVPLRHLNTTGPKRKLRVLAADDNRTNRMVFEIMVRPLNLDVRIVDDGAQAVTAFSEMQPDVIFMDISMPIVDGREAARQIRALESDHRTPIFALTAHAIDDGETDLITADFDGWLPKPLKKDQLLQQ